MKTKIEAYKKPFIFQTIILIIFVIIFLTFALKTHFVVYPQTYDELNVKFIDLNEDEKQEVYSLTDRIKFQYKEFVKNILVVKNIDDYCKKNPSLYCNGCIEKGCLGFNSNQEVVIQYDEDLKLMSIMLCHEIAHSFVFPDDPKESSLHQIVNDISLQEACYQPEVRLSPMIESENFRVFMMIFSLIGMIIVVFWMTKEK